MVRLAVTDVVEGGLQTRDEFAVGLGVGWKSGNHDVIGMRVGAGWGEFGEGCAQPSADAISDNRIADLFCDGEAKARLIDSRGLVGCGGGSGWIGQGLRGVARLAFHDKGGTAVATTAANTLELATLFEGLKLQNATPVAGRFSALLGRQALATLRTTAGKYANAAGRQHALAEAVATLAHKAARLICAFHGRLRRSLGFATEPVRAQAHRALRDVVENTIELP